MKKVAVFCGSAKGDLPIYAAHAQQLGALMAKQGLELVFGGGKVGLMGVIADAVLENGGKATGVIPGFLMEREVGHKGLTEMIVVDNMHLRKQKMAELSDAFLILAGGLGTMDELCEILTWKQLGLHSCPIGILNTKSYYDDLLELFASMRNKGFIRQPNSNYYFVQDTPESLISILLENFDNSDKKDLNKS
ncbi:MAG: TIGR00730 family Rossman fold protein [Bacteroidia bacterium]|nr:TIGR00730 family Rossman fold protein [Bacteroidia bacterium]